MTFLNEVLKNQFGKTLVHVSFLYQLNSIHIHFQNISVIVL